LLFALVACLAAAPAYAAECPGNPDAIGVERIIEIDTSTGPLFGSISKQPREQSFLKPKEVVLTFDDGPLPGVTGPILETLAEHCTHATFFSVGKMAIAYPDVVREVLARGHTVGAHTWSHAFRLPDMAREKALDEIDGGFAAVTAAAGRNIAPFFRFTGLRDSAPLLAALKERGIGSFTVDVVSNDSFIKDWKVLVEKTLRQVEHNNGGIILFHDIKPGTAKALPKILAGLKERGFKVVHMRPRQALALDPATTQKYAARVETNLAHAQREPRLMPFYGAIATLRQHSGDEPQPDTPEGSPPVTVVEPTDRSTEGEQGASSLRTQSITTGSTAHERKSGRNSKHRSDKKEQGAEASRKNSVR